MSSTPETTIPVTPKPKKSSSGNMTSFILGLLYMLLASGALLLFIELPLGPLLRIMHNAMDPKGECKAICTNCTFLVNKVDMITMRQGHINPQHLQQHNNVLELVTSKLFEAGTRNVCRKDFSVVGGENDVTAAAKAAGSAKTSTSESSNNNSKDVCSQLFAFYKETLRLRFQNILTLKYRHKNGSPLLLHHHHQSQLLQQQFDGQFPINAFSAAFTQQNSLERQLSGAKDFSAATTTSSFLTGFNAHAAPPHHENINNNNNNNNNQLPSGAFNNNNNEKDNKVKLSQTVTLGKTTTSTTEHTADEPEDENPKVPKHFDFQRSIFGSGLIPNAIEFCSLHCRPAGPATLLEKHVLANIDFFHENILAAVAIVYLRNLGRDACAVIVIGAVLMYLLRGRRAIHQHVIDIEETDEKVRKAIPVHRKFLSAIPPPATTTTATTTQQESSETTTSSNGNSNSAREQMIKLHQQQNAKLFATLESFSDENLDKFLNGEFDGAFLNAIIQEGGLVVAPNNNNNNNKNHHHHHPRVHKPTPKSSRHATPSNSSNNNKKKTVSRENSTTTFSTSNGNNNNNNNNNFGSSSVIPPDHKGGNGNNNNNNNNNKNGSSARSTTPGTSSKNNKKK